jgi:thioredoxin
MTVREINDTDFDASTSTGTVLVDFHAAWCGPCQLQGPILDTVAEEVGAGSEASIYKLDVDANRRIADRFSVRSIPYLVLLKNGQVVRTFTGLQDADTLLSALRSA